MNNVFNPDTYDVNWAKYEIETKGHIVVLDGLLVSLDCSRYIEGVGYPININHYSYARYTWQYNYTIEDGIDKGILSDRECEVYRGKLNALDTANEVFAAEHPDVGKYKKSKSTKTKAEERAVTERKQRTRRASTKDMFSGKISTETISEDGSLKKTAADRRREALSSRTVKFAFGTFKPNKE